MSTGHSPPLFLNAASDTRERFRCNEGTVLLLAPRGPVWWISPLRLPCTACLVDAVRLIRVYRNRFPVFEAFNRVCKHVGLGRRKIVLLRDVRRQVVELSVRRVRACKINEMWLNLFILQ